MLPVSSFFPSVLKRPSHILHQIGGEMHINFNIIDMPPLCLFYSGKRKNYLYTFSLNTLKEHLKN